MNYYHYYEPEHNLAPPELLGIPPPSGTPGRTAVCWRDLCLGNIISVIAIFLPCLVVLNMLLQQDTPVISISSMVYLLNVMNWGAFSTRARVTLDTHLDIDAWLIPMVSPIDV